MSEDNRASEASDWTLPPGGLDVWWCRTGVWDHWVEDLLPPDERARADRFRVPADRERYVTAHALVRVLLGRYLDRDPAEIAMFARCCECGGAHGKPRLTGGELEFSFSHSGGRVGVALARTPVGIDVEELGTGPVDPDLPAEVLAPEELAGWERLAPDARRAGLIRWWTRKEAVLKAAGVGLNAMLPRLQVSGPEEPARVLAWSDGGATYRLHDLNLGPGYLGAVAVHSSVPPAVRERDAEGLLGRVGEHNRASAAELRPPREREAADLLRTRSVG